MKTRKAARIYDSMERALLRERISAYRHRYWLLKNEGSTLAEEIRKTVDEAMWQTVDRITQEKASRTAARNAMKKDKKWERLTGGHLRRAVMNDTEPGATEGDGGRSESLALIRPVEQNTTTERRVVINLSGTEISEEAKDVLSRGLNFAVVPRRVPAEELITNIEAALSSIQPDEADEIRLEAAHLIKRARPPRENITYSQRRALMELKKRDDLIVTRADKGCATVVLSKEMYEEKMETLLDPRTYEKGIKDPTRTIEGRITRILKSEGISKKLAADMAPGDARVPRIYGLPKIHKENALLRPIVSMIGAPT